MKDTILAMLQLLAAYVHTITLDNGKEFARYEDLVKAFSANY